MLLSAALQVRQFWPGWWWRMCLVVFALDCHRDYRLVLAANRDEYFERPTAPAGFWSEAPEILAGRDLRCNGTWLGVNQDGRFAAITNVRSPGKPRPEPLSRGALVAAYLQGSWSAAAFQPQLEQLAGRCDGFNLIYGDSAGMYYFSNRSGDAGRITAGIHGLSNGLLDTPWPKVTIAKQQLALQVNREQLDPEALFRFMGAAEPFADDLLPDTGVGLENERLLSPLFIHGSDYGTRSTTLLFIDRQNRIRMIERNHYPPETREFRLSGGRSPLGGGVNDEGADRHCAGAWRALRLLDR